MTSRRLCVLLTSLALVGSPALVTAPSYAAPQTVKVSIKTSAKSLAAGKAVRIAGKVTGRSAKAVVALQRRAGGKWVTITRAKVKASKKYAFRTTVRSGATTYRVKVRANSRVRAAASARVVVTGTSASAGYTAAQKRILADTNAFRAKHGLRALEIDPAMSRVATNWSRRMGTTENFQHNPNYAQQIPSGWVRAAENIAAGQQTASVVNAWINSEGHRANMLGDHTHIGIGAVTVPGSRYVRYFTQVFAKYPNR